jgi:tetratricopeptide (TPR) repeat protein
MDLARQIEKEAAASDLLNEQGEALWLQGFAELSNFGPSSSKSLAQAQAQALALRAGNLELAVRAGIDLTVSTLDSKGPIAARQILESLKPLVAGLDEDNRVRVTLQAGEAELTLGEGNPRHAVELYRKAIELGRKVLGPDHPEVLFRELQLATALASAGDLSTARELDEKLLKRIEAALGTNVDVYCYAANNVGYDWMALGRYDEALVLLARATECLRAVYGDVPALSPVMARQAYLLARMGRGVEALELAEQAVAVDKGQQDNGPLGWLYLARGWARVAAGQPEPALADCRRALEIDEKIIGNPNWDDLLCEGRALLALGRAKDAVASLERAAVITDATPGLAGDHSDVHFALARALWSANRDRARATKLAEQALHELDELPARQLERKEIVIFLASTKAGRAR